ncbi:MAG: hypothetical protein AAGI30_11525 [Planctomycetota bacterium]
MDVVDRTERVWAMDVALRSAGTCVVIGDATGVTMAESRRLQLAAAAGRTPCWVVRPPWERRMLSAARTRWLVTPATAMDEAAHAQAWTVELLRCKGVQPTLEGARRWRVHRDHATGTMGDWSACDGDLARDVADRSAETTRARSA